MSRRWTLIGFGAGFTPAVDPSGSDLQQKETVEVMPVEDHQRLLQAEVEKREEVEAERDAVHRQRLVAADAADRAEAKRQAAESKLSSAVEELERLIAHEREIADAAQKDSYEALPTMQAKLGRIAGNADLRRQGYEEALQLLRDKGTEG